MGRVRGARVRGGSAGRQRTQPASPAPAGCQQRSACVPGVRRTSVPPPAAVMTSESLRESMMVFTKAMRKKSRDMGRNLGGREGPAAGARGGERGRQRRTTTAIKRLQRLRCARRGGSGLRCPGIEGECGRWGGSPPTWLRRSPVPQPIQLLELILYALRQGSKKAPPLLLRWVCCCCCCRRHWLASPRRPRRRCYPHCSCRLPIRVTCKARGWRRRSQYTACCNAEVQGPS
jgi:hypothetical protein